jgi:pyruvate dehydrogenase E1 component alpha subunit
MLYSRLFEAAVQGLWEEGLISGEMHLGVGEEGVIAGVVDHLIDGDALALDHRGTSALLMRGVDPVLLLREFLGYPDGLCQGQGGHMHLFSPEHLAASSGIVGASGPAAVGFALAAKRQRREGIAVAFFGEGALNQGMLMESMNLSAALNLPVLFVCKDNGWAITTSSAKVTASEPLDRARGLGLEGTSVDGKHVERVWRAAAEAMRALREESRPWFLHARCSHLEGHFLGDQMLEGLRDPRKALAPRAPGLIRALTRTKGASLLQRLRSLSEILGAMLPIHAQTAPEHDPLHVSRASLEDRADRLQEVELEVRKEITEVLAFAVHGEGLGDEAI